ncbi:MULTISPECIES: nucleoside recognition domain-containing protein [unclassified Haloferax]|uniref:nucleoside recognition domain-containing protein n=1 Tax=unclassified Haloferax TaxID=2625095 RepID=UPI0002B06462|nr:MULTISPECIES: nucleoside recognition domain-containing protein [unclassified Haloferax]ELZ59609.1 ferrous iron transport protein [Haloferax sp. ATCC BAA-646]ELZ60498.1 ferrous iron transport protein [Haloferax sp. ATCC BAA-645]ELZ72191.1 ferrous iron transport protein [Haloferax sp. ATCC BAA-644]
MTDTQPRSNSRPETGRGGTGSDRRETVVVVGKESVGKSELVAGLTGTTPTTGNFRGTTVDVERYESDEFVFVDTPGILLGTDTQTTRTAISAVEDTETVLLVVRATNIDDDLGDLLPLVQGKVGAIAVTFWDKVENQTEARDELGALADDLGVPLVPVDARNVSRVATDGGGSAVDGRERTHLVSALRDADEFPGQVTRRTGIHLDPPATVLERPLAGPPVSIALLLLPAAAAVHFANAVASELSPGVRSLLAPAVRWTSGLPGPLAAVLGGDYGLLSMGPFLFVWAGPTILLFALFMGVYKNSGLVTRITASLHPSLRHVGLTGRDLVRVVMGFGCNVPAVTSTRGCSDCTRRTTVSAIGFGSACSYQFPATLAVFAAVDMPWLVLPYVGVLATTTLVYARLIAPERARTASLAAENRAFIQWPSPRSVWREASTVVRSFFLKALPVFVGIVVLASLLDYLGILDAMGTTLSPVMALFNLPGETALVVVLGSIRKDGLLLLQSDGLSATLSAMTPVQVLTAVYLAGVLLPCLVTAITVARELSPRYAGRMLLRQAAAAAGFSLLIGWGGAALF